MVTFNSGQRTDARTRRMLDEAEKRSGRTIVVVQGSYSQGKYSAGTHSGGGVVDIRTWNQPSRDAITELTRWCREVGFAAWYRTDVGSGPHIHAVAIGCTDLHWTARDQVTDYRNGRDGLARNWRDTGPKVPFRTWEEYQRQQKATPPPKEWDELATKAEIGEVLVEKLDSTEGRDAISKALTIAFRHDAEFKDEFRKGVVDGVTLGHRYREDYQAEFEKAVRQAVRQEEQQ